MNEQNGRKDLEQLFQVKDDFKIEVIDDASELQPPPPPAIEVTYVEHLHVYHAVIYPLSEAKRLDIKRYSAPVNGMKYDIINVDIASDIKKDMVKLGLDPRLYFEPDNDRNPACNWLRFCTRSSDITATVIEDFVKKQKTRIADGKDTVGV